MSQPTESTAESPDATAPSPNVQRILTAFETIAQQREEAAKAAVPARTKPRDAWNDLWMIERGPATPPADTETLLNGLIDECGFLMREVAFSMMRTAPEYDIVALHMTRAMQLAETGAHVGLAVAKLRKASNGESRKTITLEQVERLPQLEKPSIRANNDQDVAS